MLWSSSGIKQGTGIFYLLFGRGGRPAKPSVWGSLLALQPSPGRRGKVATNIGHGDITGMSAAGPLRREGGEIVSSGSGLEMKLLFELRPWRRGLRSTSLLQQKKSLQVSDLLNKWVPIPILPLGESRACFKGLRRGMVLPDWALE